MVVRSFAFGGTVCVEMYERKALKRQLSEILKKLFLKTKQGYNSSSHHCYAVILELLPHGPWFSKILYIYSKIAIYTTLFLQCMYVPFS